VPKLIQASGFCPILDIFLIDHKKIGEIKKKVYQEERIKRYDWTKTVSRLVLDFFRFFWSAA